VLSVTEQPVVPELLWEQGTDGITWLTLNRPEAGNAISPALREDLIRRLNDANGDPLTRVVVLTAAGTRHFCTGADLGAATPRSAELPPELPERPAGSVTRAIADGAQRLINAVLDCEKPVIAAVNGTAAGIGSHLAYACDLVLAAETAKFIEVFVRRGLVVDGAGAYLLTRRIGAHRAKELIFFGDDLPAVDAERLGLVNRVVSADSLAEAARAWAQRLAEGPTVALGLGKRLVNRALDVDRTAALAEEAMAAEINMSSEDGQEGVRAFRERRVPKFKGW
jgi:2-(1,2-epoxy-1,2-dihydrophenyl)acetyl-CoA isomerase